MNEERGRPQQCGEEGEQLQQVHRKNKGFVVGNNRKKQNILNINSFN